MIDLRVQLRGEPDVAALATLPPDFASRYPTRHAQHFRRFQIEPGDVAVAPDQINGYRFISSAGNEIAQFRVDGFSFSRLQPYTDWNAFAASARSLWESYVHLVQVDAVVRVAVRYINDFVIPAGRGPSDYLTTPPELPQYIAGAQLKGALSQIHVLEPESAAICLITQTLTNLSELGMGVVLDIDAFREQRYDVAEGRYWLDLAELGQLKNRIFFGSITTAAVRDFV